MSTSLIPTTALLDQRSPAHVARIVERFESLPALKHAEPSLDGAQSAEVKKRLATIGMKAWPTQAEKGLWLKAMLMALSDLPAPIAIAALDDAIHEPFQFHNQVEPWVRERASQIRRHVNLLPWQAIRREREGRDAEQPKLETPGTRWMQADVDDANESFEVIGVGTRYRLAGDQVESYQAEQTAE